MKPGAKREAAYRKLNPGERMWGWGIVTNARIIERYQRKK